MVPKAAAPKDAFGSLSGGVLLTLNASPRNSRFILSKKRNVATRIDAGQVAVECVGRADGCQSGSGEDGLREVSGGVVDQLGKSIGKSKCQAAREALFELRLEGFIFGVRDVVTEKLDVGKA